MANIIIGVVAGFLVLCGLSALIESGSALSKDKVLVRRERRFGPQHRGS